VIGLWWRPSRLPTLIAVADAMSMVNWPLSSVVTLPTPGTFSTMPGSGTLTSGSRASMPMRVQPWTVTTVGTGGSAASALAVAATAGSLPMPQPSKPHSCLSFW